MTGIFAGIVAMVHLLIFVTAIIAFCLYYKKVNLEKSQILIFAGLALTFGVLGFFVANHFAFITKDSGVMMTVGYTAVPITQMGLSLMSYPLVYMLQTKFKVKYFVVLLGIVTSAPLSLLLAASFSQYYWEFLGKNIYGG